MHRSAQVALLALMTGIGIALSPVAAQTTTTPAPAPAAAASNCPAVPALPPMPDGAHATRAQMDAYNAIYNQWSAAAGAAKDCRRAAAEPLRARGSALVQEFNTANTRVEAINTYWTAWVDELNGHTTQRCTQEHDVESGDTREACVTVQSTDTTAAPMPDISTLGTGPVTIPNSGSQCAAIAEPARPLDISHMSVSQKRRLIPPAVEAYNTWHTAALAALVCRHDEAFALGTQADVLVNEYNTTSTQVASSATQWHNEVAEFNARGGH